VFTRHLILSKRYHWIGGGLAAEEYPEGEVGRLLREEFGCDYHPERHGMACTAWLWRVHAALWKATHRTAEPR
jgi:hypothetical protein